MSGTILYSFLIEAAVKGTALVGAAWLVVLLLRRRSAAVRHLLWSFAFAALLILPFLSLLLPALRVPLAHSLVGPGLIFRTDAQTSGQALAGELEQHSAAILPSQSRPDWTVILTIVWATGAAISFAQMLIGLAAIERLRRRATPSTVPGFVAMTKQLGIESDVNLLQTTPGSMPITFGLFRSTVFMPADANEWTAERRRVVLLHELAHVRRRDGVTHLLARVVLGLYWWNPLVWAAWREFLKERERAADDLVLQAGAGASQYASHLLEIACSTQLPAVIEWAAVAMARRSQLEGRLSAILDSSRDRKAPRRAFAIIASLAAITILLPVAALQAKSDTAPATVGNQAGIGPVGTFLLKEGDEAREAGKLDQAKAAYGKALTVLANGPEAAMVLIRLGTTELAAKNFGQAANDFERAQTMDSGKTGEARMWIAIVQQRQNNLEAANALYQSALAAEDPNSAATATIMELHAALLRQQGREDEANSMAKEAASIRKGLAASLNEPSAPDVYRAGGDVNGPALLSKVEPKYTGDARIAKYQGTALLSVEIGVDGSAHNISVVRALGFGLDQKAIEAIEQWKFKPATKDGQPVKVFANIEVNFKLL